MTAARLFLFNAINFMVSIQVHAEDLLVVAAINNKPCQEIIQVTRANDKIILNAHAIAKCQIETPEQFLSIDQSKYSLDENNLDLKITLDDYQVPSTIYSSITNVNTTEKTYAFGLNYDAVQSNSNYYTNTSALPEVLLFTPNGIFRNSNLISKINHIHKSVRLETNFVTEFPSSATRLRMGDGITRSNAWATTNRVTGIQIGTNFSNQQNFIYYPIPSIRGNSALQTPIDVFVNSSKIYSSTINQGPYEIQNIPVITGAGNIAVETTDLLGQKVYVDAPYYVSPDLLKKGLHDYTLEVGKVRNNYGLKSNSYGQAIGLVTHRYGFADNFTIENNVQASPDTKVYGVTPTVLLGDLAVLSATGAISRTHQDTGKLGQISLQRTSKTVSFGVNILRQTNKFRDIGSINSQHPLKLNIQSYVSYTHESFGSVSVSYTSQHRFYLKKARIITASYQKNFGNGYQVFINGNAQIGEKGKTIMIGITKSFDHGFSAQATTSRTGNEQRARISAQKNSTSIYGATYGGSISRENKTITGDASLAYRSPYGDISLRGNKYKNSHLTQAGASGSLIWSSGGISPHQKITSSIAIIKTANTPDIPIKLNNQIIGKTWQSGEYILPNVTTYSTNTVSLDTQEIPIHLTIPEDRTSFFTDAQGAYLISFGLQSQQNHITQIIKSDNNEPPEPGSQIVWTTGDVTLVGFNGECEIPDSVLMSIGTITSNDQTCIISPLGGEQSGHITTPVLCHP